MNPWMIIVGVVAGCATLVLTVFIAIGTAYILRRMETDDRLSE